jgi:hypothetical protein
MHSARNMQLFYFRSFIYLFIKNNDEEIVLCIVENKFTSQLLTEQIYNHSCAIGFLRSAHLYYAVFRREFTARIRFILFQKHPRLCGKRRAFCLLKYPWLRDQTLSQTVNQ